MSIIRIRSSGVVLVLTAVLCCCSGLTVERPTAVSIIGYDGDAMEPFVTRDGKYLLFNNRNEPPANTDIHFAERQDDLNWKYRGKVDGVNTPELEGCATLDRNGTMYFVSPRNYPKTLCTIYSGRFVDGKVTGVTMVESISLKQPGRVNFDVDVSADGNTLIFVDSRFKPGVGPETADLVIANWDGKQFVRDENSARLLAEVNTPALEYAPALSVDKLTLYFTRFTPGGADRGPQILRTRRKDTSSPFSKPEKMEGLGAFVEGPALSPDEHTLYFHRKDGDRFSIYCIPMGGGKE